MKFIHTADSHLGFEITKAFQGDTGGRKNRADAIYENFVSVLQYTGETEADLFIHSGDLFNKYYIPQ
jgi:DNA repair exonuclease SbcCD nuclease subunit